MMLTSNSVRLPLIIKNGLPYLEHYYPTARQMKEVTREKFITSKNTWDPTKLDDVDGASNLMISQFPPIPLDAFDGFYNDQGDIRVTKSDSKVDSKVDPAVVDSEIDPAVVGNNERYHPKPTGEEYRSKPKKKKKNQQK